MSIATLQRVSPGHYAVCGELTFYTVPDVLTAGEEMFVEGRSLDVDLAQVSRSDSAGIALMLEWTRMARKREMALRFINTPVQMLSLARVGGVDPLLTCA